MDQQALSATELRVIVAVIGVIVLALIYFFGRPRRPGQGERRARRSAARTSASSRRSAPADGEPTRASSMSRCAPSSIASASDIAERAHGRRARPVGVRPDRKIERIVTLFVAARAGEMLAGSDVVVAAEKAGLAIRRHGHLPSPGLGKADDGPVFSMANMVKPGSFDMSKLDALRNAGRHACS